jgi:GAF domain-containing protein
MITIGMAAMGIAASAIITGVFYLNFSNQIREDLRLRLRNIADIVALQLNPEELSTVIDKTDVENEFYIKYQKELSDIIKANNDVINIYTMRQNKLGTIYFYMDAGDPNYIPDPPGVISYEQPSDLLLATFASPSGTVVENGIYPDEFGSVISAYVPLYKKDGSLESILGLDIKADTVIKTERNAVQRILIYFGISIPLILLLAWFLGYRLSRQTVALSTVAARIANISEGKLETIPVSSAGSNKEAFDLIQIFNKMSGEIGSLIQNLEQRVSERTLELEHASILSEKRVRQFEAITRVSNAITSIENLHELLPHISEVISQQFGFYHVGIFLTDASNRYAVLSAANSEGGKKMIQRSHQLKIGEQGIVGYVTQTGKPRIALDVGEDANYFTNPELPSTHSEMALPLKAGDKIIGALDIQSTEVGAFTDEDFKTLSALSDQVSLAIQNARLFDQTQKTLAETEAIQRQYVRETWSRLPREEKLSGYRYSIAGVTPLDEDDKTIIAANEETKNKRDIRVPIILRGETIGTLSVLVPISERTNADQVDLIKAVAERVALSAENARLFDETTRRADRERIISDIASKIGTSVRTESILRTTATELSQLLDDADIFINLQTIHKDGKDVA